MDIFTTQLTRVVPVPIKPTQLKVKALVKDAASTKLKEDPDHLENHEYYFKKDDSGAEKRDSHQSKSQKDKEQKDKKPLPEQGLLEQDLLKQELLKQELLNKTTPEDTEYCPNGKKDPTPDDEDEHKGKNLDLYA